MWAAVLDYEHKQLTSRDIPPPERIHPDEVLFEVREVGVCGTDRELASFRIGYPPAGTDFMVLGHEALGRVVEVGSGVRDLKPGDLVVPMVRRACSPPCACCARNRRDLCLTGKYTERGIWGAHGYFTGYAVDREEDLVRVPAGVVDHAILMEPLSIVEKAIRGAFLRHEMGPGSVLILGAGPIGILAALVLQLRGLAPQVFSLEDLDHPRVRALRAAGIPYLSSAPRTLFDLVFEATGAARPMSEGLEWLAPGGVYALIGVANLPSEICYLNLIIRNQTVFGSVNASPEAFRMAAKDLESFDRRVLELMLTRVRFSDFSSTVLSPSSEAVKLVHVVE